MFARPVFTIGHAKCSDAYLIGLLRKQGITALVDTRSKPYVVAHPQFDRETLRASLADHNIAYVFMGQEIAKGVRPALSSSTPIAATRLAAVAARIEQGSRRFSIALLGTAQDPLECVRGLLLGPVLRHNEAAVQHIGPFFGPPEMYADAMRRLIDAHKLADSDLAQRWDAVLEQAVALQIASLVAARARVKAAPRNPPYNARASHVGAKV